MRRYRFLLTILCVIAASLGPVHAEPESESVGPILIPIPTTQPAGFRLIKDGDVVVFEVGEPSRVKRYSSTGILRYTHTTTMTVRDVASDHEGGLWLLGYDGHLRLEHLNLGGALVRAYDWQSDPTLRYGRIAYGADNRIYVSVTGGQLYVFDRNLKLLVTHAVPGYKRELNTRPHGVTLGDQYYPDVAFLGYGDSTAVRAGGSAPYGWTGEEAVANNGAVIHLARTYYETCDGAALSILGTDGTVVTRPVNELVDSATMLDCKLLGVDASPANEAILATIVDSTINLLWMNPAGIVVRTESVAPPQALLPGYELDAWLTDWAVDGQGRVALALTLPSATCPEGQWDDSPCSSIAIGLLDDLGTTWLPMIRGNTSNETTSDDSFQVRSHPQREGLKVIDGSIALSVSGQSFFCGPSCLPFDNQSFIAVVDAPTRDPWWRDPPVAEFTPPVWLAPTPADGTRFDLLPGDEASFTLRAKDPWGRATQLDIRYLEPDGDERPKPSFLTCVDQAVPTGSVELRCTVAPNSTGSGAVMKVQARNSSAFSSETRSFLVFASKLHYVALGDSYSAGEGVDPYFRDGYDDNDEPTDNRCHRSTRAYAEQVVLPGYAADEPLYRIASGSGAPGTGDNTNKFGSEKNVRRFGDVAWDFWACAGATTTNVLPVSQGGTIQDPQEGFRDALPQIDNPSINYGTDLVTITIGGNDAGFAEALKHCGAPWPVGALGECDTPEYRSEIETDIDAIKAKLVQVYRAIRAKTFNARILALGYPQLFPQHEDDQNCAALVAYKGEQDFLREMTTRLNTRVREAAEEAGVEFRGVLNEFEGHEVCGFAEDDWINGPSFTGLPRNPAAIGIDVGKAIRFDDESFHPNLRGQELGYAIAVNRFLGTQP